VYTLDLTKSILEEIRESVGLTETSTEFDTELIQHINAALAKLNQNGVGKGIFIKDATTTWGDFQDSSQTVGNQFFHLVPLFITLSTKIIFDPPPPSSVQFYASNAQEILWRLKIAYEIGGE